jgi:phosphatidylserine synthase
MKQSMVHLFLHGLPCACNNYMIITLSLLATNKRTTSSCLGLICYTTLITHKAVHIHITFNLTFLSNIWKRMYLLIKCFTLMLSISAIQLPSFSKLLSITISLVLYYIFLSFTPLTHKKNEMRTGIR